MLSLSVCAVTGVILALVLKSTGSQMGTFVSVVLCAGTAMLVFNGLISVYKRVCGTCVSYGNIRQNFCGRLVYSGYSHTF